MPPCIKLINIVCCEMQIWVVLTFNTHLLPHKINVSNVSSISHSQSNYACIQINAFRGHNIIINKNEVISSKSNECATVNQRSDTAADMWSKEEMFQVSG